MPYAFPINQVAYMIKTYIARVIKKRSVSESDDNRPIKTIRTGYNSWRIIYADEQLAPEN